MDLDPHEPVRAERIRAGKTQAEVARFVSHGLSWIYQIENGVTVPSLEDADKLADFLGVADSTTLFSRIRRIPGCALLVGRPSDLPQDDEGGNG